MADDEKRGPDEGGGPVEMTIEFVEHDEGPHEVVPVGQPSDDSYAAEPSAGEPAAERVKKLENSLLRQRADFENYKRRVERDQAEVGERAQAELIRALLPVLDNLDSAIALLHAEAPPQWSKGLDLCRQLFLDTLAKAGAQPVDALRQQFDPQFHEAVALTEDPDCPGGTVTDVIQRGFFFQGKLLRPARVRVNRPSQGARPETPNG